MLISCLVPAFSTQPFSLNRASLVSSSWTAFGSNGSFILGVTGSVSSNLAKSINGGSSWTYGSLPVSVAWADVTWSGAVWIAIPTTGSTAYVSADGTTWTAKTLPSSATNYQVAAAPDGTIYIVRSNAVLVSTNNGDNWVSRALPSSSTQWSSVIFDGNTVCLGDRNSNKLLRSANAGVAWETKNVTGSYSGEFALSGVAKLGAVRVATPLNGTNYVYVSQDDGASWASVSLPGNFSINTFRKGSTSIVKVGFRIFVRPASGTSLYSTIDGVTWTTSSPLGYTATGLFYDGISYIAFNTSGNVSTSTDGITWSASATLTASRPGTYLPSCYFRRADNAIQTFRSNYAEGVGFAHGSLTTNNGSTWSQLPQSLSNVISTSVVVHPDGRVMITTSGNPSASMRSSDDGVNWTAATINSSYNFAQLSILSDNSVVAMPRNGKRASVSTDFGATWGAVTELKPTYLTPSFTSYEKSVCVVGGAYYILTSVVGGAEIWSTTDFVSFTKYTIPAVTSWYGLVHDGNRFCLFGQKKIYTSVDLSSWTLVADISTGSADFITGSAKAGGGFSISSSDKNYYTTDGVTWSSNNTGVWGYVSYHDGTNYYVVPSGSNQMKKSTDNGATWVNHGSTLPISASWRWLIRNGLTLVVASHNSSSVSGSVMKSIDGGLTWSAITMPQAPYIRSASFVGGTYYLFGTNYLFTSTDTITWTATAYTVLTDRKLLTLPFGAGFVHIPEDDATYTKFYSSTDGLSLTETSATLFKARTFVPDSTSWHPVAQVGDSLYLVPKTTDSECSYVKYVSGSWVNGYINIPATSIFGFCTTATEFYALGNDGVLYKSSDMTTWAASGLSGVSSLSGFGGSGVVITFSAAPNTYHYTTDGASSNSLDLKGLSSLASPSDTTVVSCREMTFIKSSDNLSVLQVNTVTGDTSIMNSIGYTPVALPIYDIFYNGSNYGFTTGLPYVAYKSNLTTGLVSNMVTTPASVALAFSLDSKYYVSAFSSAAIYEVDEFQCTLKYSIISAYGTSVIDFFKISNEFVVLTTTYLLRPELIPDTSYPNYGVSASLYHSRIFGEDGKLNLYSNGLGGKHIRAVSWENPETFSFRAVKSNPQNLRINAAVVDESGKYTFAVYDSDSSSTVISEVMTTTDFTTWGRVTTQNTNHMQALGYVQGLGYFGFSTYYNTYYRPTMHYSLDGLVWVKESQFDPFAGVPLSARQSDFAAEVLNRDLSVVGSANGVVLALKSGNTIMYTLTKSV